MEQQPYEISVHTVPILFLSHSRGGAGVDDSKDSLTLGGECGLTTWLSCSLLRGWNVESNTGFSLRHCHKFVFLGATAFQGASA